MFSIFSEIFECLTSFYGKVWRHREKSQSDARWAFTSRLFSKKPRPSKTTRSQVIDQNVIFDLLMTLTLTFDLFYRFSIGIYSRPRGSHWPSLATIDSKLWPLEGEQTDRQTDTQTGNGIYMSKSKISTCNERSCKAWYMSKSWVYDKSTRQSSPNRII